MGGFLFLMQMHGYEHTANADEFVVSGGEGAAPVNPAAMTIDKSLPWTEIVSITIPARGDKEYKIFVEKGNTFSYAWQTDGEPLYFDFHGEPVNDTSGSFQSLAKTRISARQVL